MTTAPDITATTRAPGRRRRPRGGPASALARAACGAAAAAVMASTASACGGDASRHGAAAGGDSGALTVATTRRAVVVGFASDTLSAGARILALHPGTGADSTVIAFTFADSAGGVSAGLGVLDLRDADGGRVAHLAWPDSVRAVSWSAPHVLAFVTPMGRGVMVKVDVGADTLGVVVDSARAAAAAALRPAPSPRPPEAAIARATTFVDSAHQQPAGRAAPRAALRYAVDSLIAAPDGRLVALHVTASDSTGRRVNPAWYALALPSGAVASVDSVVGPTAELPASAGAWGGADGRTFYYARGTSVYAAKLK